MIGICDVHLWVDRDTKLRPIRWCPACDAWICPVCWGDAVRRGRAWAKRTWREVGIALRRAQVHARLRDNVHGRVDGIRGGGE